jgi:hypothetical protein
MAIITQNPAYEAQDNFWDRVRKPVGAGLMARGTPLGLLLGALLGAAKAPSDVKAEQDAEMRRREEASQRDLAKQDAEMRRREEASQRDLAKQSAEASLKTSGLHQQLLGAQVAEMPEIQKQRAEDRQFTTQSRKLAMRKEAGDIYDATKDPEATFDATGVPPSIRSLVAPVPVPGMTPMAPGAGMPVVAPQAHYPKLTGNSVADSYKTALTRRANAEADRLTAPKPASDAKLPDGFVEVYKTKTDLLKKKLAEQYDLNQKKVPTEKRGGLDEEVGRLYREISAMEQQMKGAGKATQDEPTEPTKTIDFNSW